MADWIKRDVFGIDPKNVDPGRVTIRRLNRVEYRNTIRDLTGFDFKAEEEFPPDDTGYGFDTIGDVLSVSPLLLEKYMQAAESIVTAAVPTVSQARSGAELSRVGVPRPEVVRKRRAADFLQAGQGRAFPPYRPGRRLRVAVDLAVNGAFIFDPGRCVVTFQARRSRALAGNLRLARRQDVSLRVAAKTAGRRSPDELRARAVVCRPRKRRPRSMFGSSRFA